MKIVHIVADGRPGGGAINTLDLIKRSAPQHEVHCIVEPDSQLSDELKEVDATLYPVIARSNVSLVGTFARIRSIIQSINPDIIHSQGMRSAAIASLSTIGTAFQSRHIITVRGYHSVNSRYFRPIRIWIDKVSQSMAKHIVVVSRADNSCANTVFGLPEEKVSLIYNGVLFEKEDGGKFRDIDVCFVGRLIRQKDPGTLLHALRLVVDRRISVCVVGEGELEHELKQLALTLPHDIIFEGALEHSLTLDRIRRAKMLVSTSIWEGMATVLLEALANCTPIVASRITQTRELDELLGSEWLFSPGDSQGLASRITETLVDWDQRHSKAAAARNIAVNLFDSRVTAQRYLDLYERVSNSGSRK